MSINFEFDSIECAIVRYHDFMIYQANNHFNVPDIFSYDGESMSSFEIEYNFKNIPAEKIREYRRINNNHRRRRDRYFNKIYPMFQNFDCFFFTLTFTDDVLKSTSEQTRRKYVWRYLKSCSDVYLGNIDFGVLSDREHYHAIVGIHPDETLPFHELEFPTWNFGFKKVIRCKKSDTSIQCLANYVLKLTNHALKTGTKNNRVIYPRKRRIT